jgi:hypothetical protein
MIKFDSEFGFAYDPESGRVWRMTELKVWRERADGYILSGSNRTGMGRRYQITHIAYKVMTGDWPPKPVMDHIDGNPANCKWANLRPATIGENNTNRRPNGNRWFGLDENLEPGVSLYRWANKSGKSYRVRVAGVSYGTYGTAEEANLVAAKVRRGVFGEFVPEKPFVRRI